MNRERVIYALSATATALAAAAHLVNGTEFGAAAAVCIGLAWLTAWRRGSAALIDAGFVALLVTAAIGGRAAAVAAAGAALAAWDAMRAERALRPFAHIAIRANVERTRARLTLLAAGGGTVVGLAAFAARTAVPSGALSFGALAALILISVVLVATAVRAARRDSTEQ
jgi:hypothetical protein